MIVALYPVVKESFPIYCDIAENNGILVDRFMEQEVHGCVKVYEMFCRVCKQFNELDCSMAGARVLGTQRLRRLPQSNFEVMGLAEGLWKFFFAVKSRDFGGCM